MRTNIASSRPTWNTPKLQELGNLRSLVRVGNANGKSKISMDGGSACGAESMDTGRGDCPN